MAGQILRMPVTDRPRASTPEALCMSDRARFGDPVAAWLWTATADHRRAFYSLPALRSAILAGVTRDCLRHLAGEMAALHRELASVVGAMRQADDADARSLRGVARAIARDLARLEADLAWIGQPHASARSSAAGEATALLLSTFRQTGEVVGAGGLAATLSVCRATLSGLSRRLVLATQVRWQSCDPRGFGYWLALDAAIGGAGASRPPGAGPEQGVACRTRQAMLAQTKLVYAVTGLAFSHALAFHDLAGDPPRPAGRS
ncbi:MAG: hypothetical protein U1E62_15195 [Alsobacter sp.]